MISLATASSNDEWKPGPIYERRTHHVMKPDGVCGYIYLLPLGAAGQMRPTLQHDIRIRTGKHLF